jgi:2-amino-4-hydroxy-6-hydroxymethyldihydropteridine diphosphokinase
VYIGLGSNLGDREAYLKQAIQEIEKCGVIFLKLSSIIETDPVGGPPQGKFLNAVAQCETALDPLELLHAFQNIEKSMGRTKTVTDGPRVIDIDILLYNKLTIQSTELTIPHPRMLEREFVMQPLREIAPELAKELS